MNNSIVRYSFAGPPTSGVIVRGAGYCCYVTVFLTCQRSAWFEVTPLPNDEYKITYKDEHHKAVLAHCQESSAKAVLAEFVTDVEAFGVEETEVEWPDLLITYRKAKAFFENQ